METTIVLWGLEIRIMDKKTESTIEYYYWNRNRDHGKENGHYYRIIGYILGL